MIGELETARFSVERAIRENDTVRRFLRAGAAPGSIVNAEVAAEQVSNELHAALGAIEQAQRETREKLQRDLGETQRKLREQGL